MSVSTTDLHRTVKYFDVHEYGHLHGNVCFSCMFYCKQTVDVFECRETDVSVEK